ncbi:hypothetical protein DPMN_111488 [Dreissena polymorpha]|uniref:Uncharacterized protein n=1 Tax=Dreissena polymorpha TaxID=45954 RepID=A0A9D4QPU4_DREPO|nr:hypothetical protein DPMN_111488 [Dreissena polymorpha]
MSMLDSVIPDSSQCGSRSYTMPRACWTVSYLIVASVVAAHIPCHEHAGQCHT